MLCVFSDQVLVLISFIASCVIVLIICLFMATLCAGRRRGRAGCCSGGGGCRKYRTPRKYHVMSEQDIPEELPMMNSSALSDED